MANSTEKLPLSSKVKLTIMFVGFFFAVMSCATAVWAYFSIDVTGNSPTTLNINTLFGILDSHPVGSTWGTETNPYLIHTQQHLNNLYKVQSNRNRTLINENTYFQVSNPNGAPCFVGGNNSDNLLEISSIGSEDFPFISTIRGITGATYTLPDGEITDTSAIANVRIIGQGDQIDIGLFGNVGPAELPSNGQPVGEISNLLLSNIQVLTTSSGDTTKTSHNNYFTSSTPHETNHIGILAGHAQNTLIYDISVYYTDTNPSAAMSGSHSAKVAAFNINPASSAKYTTSGGIIGYYKNLFINPHDISHPVNSDGYDDFGGTVVGFGLGIVYSEDIWRFMEKNYFPTTPITEDEYGIQDIFDEKLYGDTYNPTDKKQNTYFRIGVFTFAHSTQVLKKDRIAKLWKAVNEEDKYWSYSSNGNYTSAPTTVGTANQYRCAQIQSTHLADSGSGTNRNWNIPIGTGSTFPRTTHRYMIVATSGNVDYVLTRYGFTAAAQRITIDTAAGSPSPYTSTVSIPEDQLEYYSFTVFGGNQANTNFPPYTSGASYTYITPLNSIRLSHQVQMQFFVYGKNIYDTANNRYSEGERPLRLYTGSASFMASSVTNPFETIYITTAGSGTSTTFRLYRGSNGANNTSNPYTSYALTYSATAGFTSSSTATQVRIFAVNTTPIGTPNYNKLIYSPTAATTQTIDMSTHTLHYIGDSTSTTEDRRYRYNIRSIASLEWAGNDGLPITKAQTVIKMGDPTSYYLLSGVTWGLQENIPSPAGTGTISVPRASIGFTVNNDAAGTITSRIFIIVATDPSQDVDQLITVSYINGTGSSATRTESTNFPLPTVPGSTASTTRPIYVCNTILTSNCPTTGNSNSSLHVAAYPNLNTLLVSAEISVSVPRGTRTFFLEASKGSANFVYLSAERTAAKDSNPDHENDLDFHTLAGIDFVTMQNNIIQTVTRTNTALPGGYYIQSLIVPYFGLKTNPANPDGTNPAIDAIALATHALDPYRFTWSITRCYFTTERKHVLFIYANNIGNYGTNLSEANIRTIIAAMNFNYTEESYLDQVAYAFVYSDIVYDYLNNTRIDWTKITY